MIRAGILKKECGSIGDILAVGICVLAMTAVMVGFYDCMGLLQEKNKVSQVAREYILRMETVGYLRPSDTSELQSELSLLKVSEVNLNGSTFSQVGYGEQISLQIRGKLRGKYEIEEKRVSTAKH